MTDIACAVRCECTTKQAAYSEQCMSPLLALRASRPRTRGPLSGNSGHRSDIAQCPLMTQSGHSVRRIFAAQNEGLGTSARANMADRPRRAALIVATSIFFIPSSRQKRALLQARGSSGPLRDQRCPLSTHSGHVKRTSVNAASMSDEVLEWPAQSPERKGPPFSAQSMTPLSTVRVSASTIRIPT